jgi:hypothetical protein
MLEIIQHFGVFTPVVETAVFAETLDNFQRSTRSNTETEVLHGKFLCEDIYVGNHNYFVSVMLVTWGVALGKLCSLK